MRFIAIFCVFMATMALKAEQFSGFMESIYDELHLLDLSKSQEIALKNVIKNHHQFLRQCHIDIRKNNEKLLKNFADSTLKSNANEFVMDKNLANDRISAEHRFMMSVYEILDAKQRRIFSNKIKSESNEAKKSKHDANHIDTMLKYGN